MNPEAFAAKRRETLLTADDRLAPVVQAGLTQYGEPDWTVQILDTAEAIWLENFQAEAPGANYAPALARFRVAVEEYLQRTSDPGETVQTSQVSRVTRWLSTLTVNAGTTQGAYSRGIRFKRWTTMADADVRDIHRSLAGQTRPIGGTFNVGGYSLAYPGEPVGPPEGWIECRCVIQPASLTGETMSANTFMIEPEDDDNPDIVLGNNVMSNASGYDSEDGEEPAVATFETAEVIADEPVQNLDDDTPSPVEVPIHGVLAPEGVLTGDSRGFREGALSTRPLPVPYRYEYVSSHGGNQTSQVATVGRVDEAWRDETTGMWRFKGVILLDKPYANEALAALIDGSGTGVSIDADEMVQDVSGYFDEQGNLKEQVVDPATAGKPDETWYSMARVAGLTQVPIPAFHEAYAGLGHEFEEDMSGEDRDAAVAALAACGCLDGFEITDVSSDPEANARAQAAADALQVREALDNDAYEAAVAENPDLAVPFRDVPTVERKRLADEGAAMPDGSFPIANCQDLKNAIQAIGRASDPEAVKAHIRKRKAALGCDDVELPDTWALKPWPGDLTPEEQAEFLAAVPGLMAQSVLGLDPSFARQVIKHGSQEAALAADAADFAAKTGVYAPGTHDGPGWITHPTATARLRRYWTHGEGAAKIAWGTDGDFNRCRAQLAKYVTNPDWLAGLCANMHKEALGIWPATHAKARQAALIASGGLPAPIMTLEGSITAAASTIYAVEAFTNPNFDAVTPMHIDRESRRVWGHLAAWKSCHIGIAGACQRPPHSATGYANFLKGVVDTENGDQRVGTLTYGIGHANPQARAAAATAHYDKTDAVRAYVNVGEDKHGIWFAGVLAPWTTDEDIDAMRAIGSLSGDWRMHPGVGYDLVAAVAVNTPGFSVSLAASGGIQTTLILSNVDPEPLEGFALDSDTDENEAYLARAVARALRIIETQKRADTVRARLLAARLDDVRARITERV